jgi:RES domain-containing protein
MLGNSIEDFTAGLRKIRDRTIPFAACVYRSCTPNYARHTHLVSGMGAKELGGRWNPVGVATVYASLTPETAMAEALAHHRYYGIPIHAALPRTFVSIEVRLSVVLDLCDGEIRQRFGFSRARMLTHDWREAAAKGQASETQACGGAVASLGWEGMIVPSAADTPGRNLVIFSENLRESSGLTVINADRLNPG